MKFKFLKAALAGLVFLTMPVTTYAVPILLGETDAATGISGLEIGGDVYDVVFSDVGSCVDLCESPLTFLNNRSGAQVAATAISLFLSHDISGITNLSGPGFFSQYLIVVPYEITATDYRASVAACAVLTIDLACNDNLGIFGTLVGVTDFVSFASFSLAGTALSVDSPPTAAILALGLMGLASRRFKKKS